MRYRNWIVMVICLVTACGLIEDSQDIPDPGSYIAIDERGAYESILEITKNEKGYDISLTEYSSSDRKEVCVISATGKKSSYGIWVEIPAYGPRLPIIITKRNDGLEISLKSPDDPKSTFTYCLSDRTPAGIYQRNTE